MAAPAQPFRIHPTEADFDEHARDLADLDVVRARKAWLPADSPEREILDAREAHVKRRIRTWVDRFTGLDSEAPRVSDGARAGAGRSDIRWEGPSTSR